MASKIKIVVVGLGVGGLVAATRLMDDSYNNGLDCDVTILERRSQSDVVHDWHDRFDFQSLRSALGIDVMHGGDGSIEDRADSAFVSPSKRTSIKVHYSAANRPKVIWRPYLHKVMVDNAVAKGVRIVYDTEVLRPAYQEVQAVDSHVQRMCGVFAASKGGAVEKFYEADLVIDASGALSALRRSLPPDWGIEALPRPGDMFYAYRAYHRIVGSVPDLQAPFEVYLIHEGEQGLSWLSTTAKAVDVLIGRIYPIDDSKVAEQLDIFKQSHPWLDMARLDGKKAEYALIPVRRPLAKMVGYGYAAVGDSAFMTLPMNGMGIDLSIKAGVLLSDYIAKAGVGIDALWAYNRAYLQQGGALAAKNEGLKNALLNLPKEGVDFLFDNAVIESADLAGGGKNTSLVSLCKKLLRGLRRPRYFFAVIRGLIRGGRNMRLLSAPPKRFEPVAIAKWAAKIDKNVVRVACRDRDDPGK